MDSLNQTQQIEKTCRNRQEREFSWQENQGREKKGKKSRKTNGFIHILITLIETIWACFQVTGFDWGICAMENGGMVDIVEVLSAMTHQQLWALMGGNGISLQWKRISTASADSGASVCVADTHQRRQMEAKFQPKGRRLWDCMSSVNTSTDQSLTHTMNFSTNPRLSKQRSDHQDPCFCFQPNVSSRTLWLLEHIPVKGHLNWDLWAMGLETQAFPALVILYFRSLTLDRTENCCFIASGHREEVAYCVVLSSKLHFKPRGVWKWYCTAPEQYKSDGSKPVYISSIYNIQGKLQHVLQSKFLFIPKGHSHGGSRVGLFLSHGLHCICSVFIELMAR